MGEEISLFEFFLAPFNYRAAKKKAAKNLEKAKLSEPCLLRLKVSNRGGPHQALNVALVNFCGPGLFLGVLLSP